MRIFLAFTSDLEKERKKLKAVIESLSRIAESQGLILELIDWRQAVPNLGRPQEEIFKQTKPESWDVFVGILWHRFGTPPGAHNSSTGKAFASGVEEEFKAAAELWNKYGQPRVIFYRCGRNPPLSALDPEEFKKVKGFFDEFAANRSHPGLYQTYKTVAEFERMVRDHLEQIILGKPKPSPKQSGSRPGATAAEQMFASLVLRGIKETYYRALDEKLIVCPNVRVNLMVPEKERLRIRFVDDARYYTTKERKTSWSRQDGKCGAAWKEGAQQLFVKNAAKPDEYFEQMESDDETLWALKSVISTPVKQNGQTIGVLNLDSPHDGDITKFTDLQIRSLLTNLADHVTPLLTARERRAAK